MKMSTGGGRSPSEGAGEMLSLFLFTCGQGQHPGYTQLPACDFVRTDVAGSDYANGCSVPRHVWSLLDLYSR